MKYSVRALALGVVCFGLAGVFGQRLRERPQEKNGSGGQGVHLVGLSVRTPATVSLATVALGGFRGVAADLLWLRAGRLQEERRFVELLQLSEWITALEPEAPEVWSFHAWNLAYNVTILLGRPDDRWRWVESAISLLRDRGAEMNPSSPLIKRELAWLFLHKIGTDSDSAAEFYRTSWAREISGWLAPDGSAPAPDSLQADELFSVLKMDAGTMADLEKRFGRIDWRMPEASALYWSALSVENAENASDRLRSRRMVYSSLLTMMRHHGFAKGDASSENWTFSSVPNLLLVDSTGEYLEETMRENEFSGVRFAYAGWLNDAILIRMAQGKKDEAVRLHGKLVSFFETLGVSGVPPLEKIAGEPPGYLSQLLENAL